MNEILSKNYIVEKSKALIWAKFSEYNLGEMRLIDTYLSKINARDEGSSEVVFSVDEYLNLLGYAYPNKVKSKDIEKTLDKLLGARIKIDLNNNGDYIKVNLFSDARVVVSDPDYGKRTITIDCNPKLKEAFFGIAEKGYVEYKLDYSLRLKSKYAIKLYSLLKDNLYKKEWVVDLKDLRELVGATNKNNESFREFNKVLQKCQSDISEVTDIEFEYEKLTKGRLTRGILFKIKKKYYKKPVVIDVEECDELPGQMNVFDFPEYLPDEAPERPDLMTQREKEIINDFRSMLEEVNNIWDVKDAEILDLSQMIHEHLMSYNEYLMASPSEKDIMKMDYIKKVLLRARAEDARNLHGFLVSQWDRYLQEIPVPYF